MGIRQTWTEEQRAVIEDTGQGLLVSAGAGSGKTTTMIGRCLRLLERNPEARVCVVSFTERSSLDLREKFVENGIGLLDGAHWVTTLHGMCRSIIRDFSSRVDLAGDETMLDEQEARSLWSKVVEGCWLDGFPAESAIRTLLKRESLAGLQTLLDRARRGWTLGHLHTVHSPHAEEANALVQVLQILMQDYERVKRARGVMDFDDLEILAERLLELEDIRAYYHRRFDLVIVDEFQDTNPLQAKLISHLARPNGQNLIVVGDAKQSIYRFRDADVRLFEAFGSRLARRLSLTVNFRSQPKLLALINAVCEKVFAESEIVYEPLTSGVQVDPSSEGHPIQVFHQGSPEDLARWLRSQLDLDPEWLKDTALLMRRMRSQLHWIQALRLAGVPLSLSSGGWHWEDPELRELVAFIQAFFDPGQDLSAALFFRSPWCREIGGMTLNETDLMIDGWRAQDPPVPVMRGFLQTSHPIAMALRPLAEVMGDVRPGQVVEALLDVEGVESWMGSKVLWLWHWTEERSYRGELASDILHQLAVLLDETPRTAELPPPNVGGALRVMTIHASKGLEFERVILIDFGDPPRASPAPLLFWDRNDGAFLGARDEHQERTKECVDESRWRKREQVDQLHECRRLFYVALTRAKSELVFVLPQRKKPVPASELRYQVDDWRGWVEGFLAEGHSVDLSVSSDPNNEANSDKPHKDDQAIHQSLVKKILPWSGVSQLVRPRHSATEWRTLDQCRRKYAFLISRTPVPQTAPGQKGGGAQALGTEVHKMIQWRDRAMADQIASSWGRERVDPHAILDWVETSEFWNGVDEAWDELFFEHSLECDPPVVCVGGMDRVVRKGNQYWILDYKIMRHPPTGHEIERDYRVPMAMYQAALESLEPEAKQRTSQVLIVFSPKGIQTIPISGQNNAALLHATAEQSKHVIESLGIDGDPSKLAATPGKYCRVCNWKALCPDALMSEEAEPDIDEEMAFTDDPGYFSME